MKRFLIIFLTLALLVSAGSFVFAGGQQDSEGAVEDDMTVEVLHWWTSGGEAAALNVLKEDLEAQGIEWIDSPIAGGGGTQAMTVLRSRATAGNPPAAAQMLGFDIIDWAKLGFLANLNDLAAKEGWDAVTPDAIKGFSKYDGVWVAAPVNVHSTNWVWANKAILDEIGVKAPINTWDDYIMALDKAKAAGYIALAHGGQAWQDATIFDGVVISAGGPDFYKKAMIDLDDAALRSDTMLEAFKRMDQLRGYVDDNFSGRDWNLASSMVIEKQAAFQMMGDWAKGEFFNAGKVAGEDFVAFRTPGTQGTVTFNSDQFVMFKVEASKQAAQEKLASAVMSPSFQIAFNTVKGSVPARTDVSDAEFTIIGKKGMKDLAEAGKNGTLFGSMAHGHGAPAAVQEAVYDVVTSHFNGMYTAEEAVQELADAVAAANM
jgi:glucose/mannose transport system substrate-binding protein